VTDIGWDIGNHRTAEFRGQKLLLPWRWREDAWTNYNDFAVSRVYLEPPFRALVLISYEDSTLADFQSRIDQEQKSVARLSQYGIRETLNVDTGNPQFLCVDHTFTDLKIRSRECYSRDGRWDVTWFGPEQSRQDFETILNRVASMGNPSK
jgi:hypothetical protein